MQPAPLSLPPPGGPPAGWYPDPGGQGMRYFDGARWAPHPGVALGPATVPDREPFPTLPVSAALWALVILAVSLVVNQIVARQIDDTGLPVLVDAGIGMLLAYGPSVWWCLHVLRRSGGGAGARLGWRARPVDLGWGPLTWIGAYVAEIVVVLLATELLGVPFESNVETTSDDLTAAYVIALLASAVIAAPLVEELVFRGVVLRGLASRVGVVAAVPIQGVLFGIAHLDPISRGWGNIGLILGLSTVGCGFGLVAVLTRRLGAPILAHACLNGFVVTLVLTGVTDDLERDVGRVALRVAAACC